MVHAPHVDLQALLREQPYVRALARALVAGGHDDADEVVQRTWLQVLQHRGGAVDRPRPWLNRVVHNVARNLARSDRRRREHESAAAATGAACPAIVSRATEGAALSAAAVAGACGCACASSRLRMRPSSTRPAAKPQTTRSTAKTNLFMPYEIWMRRDPESGDFGQVTVRTPSRRSAVTLAPSMGRGRWNVRLNAPRPRSTR